jgi:hypothetical protein
MSSLTATATSDATEHARLTKLCTAIRGKLQFMDYLVRAALADVDRHRDETDPGTRIFIRQLVEMHAANLARESQNMRLVGELCGLLEGMVADAEHGRDLGPDFDHGPVLDHDQDPDQLDPDARGELE